MKQPAANHPPSELDRPSHGGYPEAHIDACRADAERRAMLNPGAGGVAITPLPGKPSDVERIFGADKVAAVAAASAERRARLAKSAAGLDISAEIDAAANVARTNHTHAWLAYEGLPYERCACGAMRGPEIAVADMPRTNHGWYPDETPLGCHLSHFEDSRPIYLPGIVGPAFQQDRPAAFDRRGKRVWLDEMVDVPTEAFDHRALEAERNRRLTEVVASMPTAHEAVNERLAKASRIERPWLDPRGPVFTDWSPEEIAAAKAWRELDDRLGKFHLCLTDFGAIPDMRTDNSAAIKNAIAYVEALEADKAKPRTFDDLNINPAVLDIVRKIEPTSVWDKGFIEPLVDRITAELAAGAEHVRIDAIDPADADYVPHDMLVMLPGSGGHAAVRTVPSGIPGFDLLGEADEVQALADTINALPGAVSITDIDFGGTHNGDPDDEYPDDISNGLHFVCGDNATGALINAPDCVEHDYPVAITFPRPPYPSVLRVYEMANLAVIGIEDGPTWCRNDGLRGVVPGFAEVE